MGKTKNFLLIHGAYHGAWCWDELKQILEDGGVNVYTIDLPGHGADTTDRSTVDLNTYVSSVEDYIKINNLSDLIIVGHSFAGVIITQLLKKIPEKIIKAVFVNAIILDNESFFDYFSQEIREKYTEIANGRTDKSIPPNKDSLRARLFTEISESKYNEIFEKLTPQPLMPYRESVNLDGLKNLIVKLYYIYLTKDISFPAGTFEKMLAKLPSCSRIDLVSDHEVMFSHPKELSDILLSL